MKPLTAPSIVSELDKSIVGHAQAKRTLAIGIRNRWRSLQAHQCDARNALPFRYIISGPSGVGKTSLVLQAAQAINAPVVQLHALQMASSGFPEQAAVTAIESAIERVSSHYPTPAQAVHAVSTTGLLLIDGIDRLFPVVTADDSHDVELDSLQQAFQRQFTSTSIHTQYGTIETKHMLVVTETHLPSGRLVELWPELHALFPYRMDLETLADDQLTQILSNPASSPIHYYVALLATEGLKVGFTHEALEAIAWDAAEMNRKHDDTGARRLNNVIETVLDDLLFDPASASAAELTIDAGYVASRLMVDGDDDDLADFIL